MSWLASNWWQVALVVLGFLIWREVRASRVWLHNIFEAIWSHPEMEAMSKAAAEERESKRANPMPDIGRHWPDRVAPMDSSETPEPRSLHHPKEPAE